MGEPLPMQHLPHANPKDTIGTSKLMMNLMPDSAIAGITLAFAEGMMKYGHFNWRVTPVRFSIYDAAAMRHRAKMRAGEWADPTTCVPHWASICACYIIIEDAQLSNTLIDDRPPAQPALLREIDSAYAEIQKVLQKLFEGKDPVHHFIGGPSK